MSEYTPDGWVFVKHKSDEEEFIFVIAGWAGGYLEGDSYRKNSGTIYIQEEEDRFIVTSFTGSKYICMKHSEGRLTSYVSGLVASYIEILSKKGDEVALVPSGELKKSHEHLWEGL